MTLLFLFLGVLILRLNQPAVSMSYSLKMCLDTIFSTNFPWCSLPVLGCMGWLCGLHLLFPWGALSSVLSLGSVNVLCWGFLVVNHLPLGHCLCIYFKPFVWPTWGISTWCWLPWNVSTPHLEVLAQCILFGEGNYDTILSREIMVTIPLQVLVSMGGFVIYSGWIGNCLPQFDQAIKKGNTSHSFNCLLLWILLLDLYC